MNQTKSTKIAFIHANWHSDIVQECYSGFISGLEGEIPKSNIDVFVVPGSLEIPLQSQILAKTGEYGLIVASGFIVNGGIYRHEFVAQAVLDGIMKVQLDYEIPILSVVLTPHNFQNSTEQRNFFLEHFNVKGREAAAACLSILDNYNKTRKVA